MYRQKDFFWGAVAGGTIATLTALLFTTKKGKQIQRQIAEIYEEVEGNVKDALSECKDDLEETVDHAGKKVASKAKSAADHLKDSK